MRNAAQVADLISCLCKAPQTIPELERLTGMQHRSARLWLEALRLEGLVYIKEYRRPVSGPAPAVWAWQPALAPLVAHQQDAVKPEKSV